MVILVLILSLFFLGRESQTVSVAPNSSVATPSATPNGRPTPHATSSASNQTKKEEQSFFGMEEEVRRPVGLPEGVLQILTKDKYVQKNAMKNYKPTKDITASLFLASEIDLNNDNMADLVVQGSPDSGLFAAHSAAFWVFHSTPKGYRLVLHVFAEGVWVLKTKTRGFRDIKAINGTLLETITDLYVFSGRDYTLKWSRTKNVSR
jgi:hypothetical protein